MPVNMDVTNSIIQAFQAGRHEKLRREELQLRKEKEANDKKEREAALKEQQHQFDTQQKTIKEHFDAQQKLREITQQFKSLEESKKAQESYVKTGLVPPGYDRTFGGSEDMLENKATGTSFQVPFDAAEQVAERERVLTSPKIEGRIREIQAREQEMEGRQIAVEAEKTAGRAEVQKERMAALKEISSERGKVMFDVAKLKTKATIDAIHARGVKSGVKLKPISDKQVNELSGLTVLEKRFSALRDMIVANPEFLQSPVEGGLSNLINTVTRGEPKIFQEIRALQASVQAEVGHDSYGSALTNTEVKRLTAEIGALGRGESLDSGLAKLNTAIQLFTLRREERLKLLAAGGRDVSGIKSPKSVKEATPAKGRMVWNPKTDQFEEVK